MQLWDKDSGNLTDFTTHFSFAIDSQNIRSVYGDGIAFFLAPVGSKIPLLTKGGSTMGLSRDDQALDLVDNPFVAVEFDIYSNDYLDPPGEHVAVGLGSGGFVLVGGLALVLFALWKKSRRNEEEDYVLDDYIDEEFERARGPRKFSYNELVHATNDFDDKEKLGQGGFGAVYRGLLRDSNTFVAVKRVAKGSKQGLNEYKSKVKIISLLRHKNLGKLIGWCHEKRELLLVYDFMPNGSLDSHIFREEIALMWAVRYKIAQGLASSLLYLHKEWEQCVLHRDIKSSNIMLDSNFNAKLGDFGLARLVDHVTGSQTTNLVGTMGYMAPKYITTSKATKESDIYSFGIVLEIAYGRKAINHMAIEEEAVMVEWVREPYRKGQVLEAADQRLGGNFDEQQMECLIIVGLWCAHPNYNLRPSIKQVVHHVLNFEAPLPILPSKMSVPTDVAPGLILEEDKTNL
nr:l-type lectin-domain containing receptor kinase ix.1 [Quercus suber]